MTDWERQHQRLHHKWAIEVATHSESDFLCLLAIQLEQYRQRYRSIDADAKRKKTATCEGNVGQNCCITIGFFWWFISCEWNSIKKLDLFPFESGFYWKWNPIHLIGSFEIHFMCTQRFEIHCHPIVKKYSNK